MIFRVLIFLLFAGPFKLEAQLPDLSKGFNDVYGSYCGIAGSHPAARIQVETYIASGNDEAILSWLRSPSMVKKVYAAEAIRRLNRPLSGMTDEDNNAIATLRESNLTIPTCRGCIYEDRIVRKIMEEINSVKIERSPPKGNPIK